MNCSTCQKHLVAYLGGELPEDTQRLTAAHLDNCSQCSELYREMVIAERLMDAEKAIMCNPFLVTRVMTAIENQEQSPDKIPAFKKILQTALIAASIAIAVLGGIEAGSLYTSTPEKKTIPDEMVFMNDASLESLNIYATQQSPAQ